MSYAHIAAWVYYNGHWNICQSKSELYACTEHVVIVSILIQVSDKTYFEITNSNSSVAQLSIMLIILGLFVMIVGGVGTAGAIFATNMFGRITLGLVCTILLTTAYMSIIPACICTCTTVFCR